MQNLYQFLRIVLTIPSFTKETVVHWLIHMDLSLCSFGCSIFIEFPEKNANYVLAFVNDLGHVVDTDGFKI